MKEIFSAEIKFDTIVYLLLYNYPTFDPLAANLS